MIILRKKNYNYKHNGIVVIAWIQLHCFIEPLTYLKFTRVMSVLSVYEEHVKLQVMILFKKPAASYKYITMFYWLR